MTAIPMPSGESVHPRPRPADRFPHIAFSLGQQRIDEAYWAVRRIRDGAPLAEMDHAELLSTAECALSHMESLESLLEAVEFAIPTDRPTTLAQVIEPIRAYLEWTLDAGTPFTGASAFVGEAAQFGHIRRVSEKSHGLVLPITDRDLKTFLRQARNGRSRRITFKTAMTWSSVRSPEGSRFARTGMAERFWPVSCLVWGRA
ncbi:hypothetical protein ACFZDG_01495 [Kitasatospora xanthocidica]|uniref:hypothetical protein n=1 Tax=Kitasatospora xanthocidica TaxID=83382 RepID=UPI0036EDD628